MKPHASSQQESRRLALIKAGLFIACLLPIYPLLNGLFGSGDLGANPVETIQRWTGTWAFNCLLLTLCITPLRACTGAHWLTRLRRMLGLFSFFYALLHFLAFIGFDHAFDLNDIVRDIAKRPFVTAGFAAFVILVPLAATSSQWAIRRLGGRRWQSLHRAIYPAAIIACLHYFWLVKASALVWPIAYALSTAALLGWRAKERQRKAIQTSVPAKPARVEKPVQFFRQRPK